MKQKRKHRFWTSLSVSGIILCGVMVYLVIKEEPPVKKMERIQDLLSEAEREGGSLYCEMLWKEVQASYDAALNSWREENKKWIVFRRFDDVEKRAEQAYQQACLLVEQTGAVKENSKEELKTALRELREESAGFEKVFVDLPLQQKIKDRYAEGKLRLNNAEIAYRKGDYVAGNKLCHQAAVLIRDSFDKGRELLKDYFKDLALWQKKEAEARNYSRERKTCVLIIEKFPACCKVYDQGVKKGVYVAELGRNWMGDKQYEGDKATPEGTYRVVKKKKGRQTKYYKALLLDYPNCQDRLEFEQRKREGKIKDGAGIGAGIEIHGGGGRGAHWTDGCVALRDQDMDHVYRWVGEGTKVVIIGASRPWEEILKFPGYGNRKHSTD